jgi:hypothetical protein
LQFCELAKTTTKAFLASKKKTETFYFSLYILNIYDCASVGGGTSEHFTVFPFSIISLRVVFSAENMTNVLVIVLARHPKASTEQTFTKFPSPFTSHHFICHLPFSIFVCAN